MLQKMSLSIVSCYLPLAKLITKQIKTTLLFLLGFYFS